MKLLPASVNPVDPSQGPEVSSDVSNHVSNSLVPLAQRAIATRAGQASLAPSADNFSWSSGTRQGGVNCIDATPVEDSQSDQTGGSGGEYVSGGAWSGPVERTVVAHYLFYSGSAANGSGRLVDVYA